MVKRRGFALLDALIGGVLLGLAMVVVIGLTGAAVSSQAKGERYETAAMLIDERLNLVLAVGPEAYPGVFKIKGQCDEPFEDYAYELEITPRPDGDPYSVKATISWRGAGGTKRVSVDTLIAPRIGDDIDPDRKPQEPIDRSARQQEAEQ